MATVVKFGPADHGRPMTWEEFSTGSWEEGYQYELIDGRLYVSPSPDLPHDRIEGWLRGLLQNYAQAHPEVINYVSGKGRIFVPGRRRTTCPEPDMAAYHAFPRHLPFRLVHWQDVSPVLVVEVISPDNAEKDLVRNVALYLQVPSIREYWLLDTREDVDHLTMLVYRRRGRRWQNVIEVAFGETYTTRLLPGFELLLDPHR